MSRGDRVWDSRNSTTLLPKEGTPLSGVPSLRFATKVSGAGQVPWSMDEGNLGSGACSRWDCTRRDQPPASPMVPGSRAGRPHEKVGCWKCWSASTATAGRPGAAARIRRTSAPLKSVATLYRGRERALEAMWTSRRGQQGGFGLVSREL